MKKVFIAYLLFSLTIVPALAQNTTVDDIQEDFIIDESPGITPDSFLYGLDVALDQLTLLMTFDKGEKAKAGLEIARERLLEVREMTKKNKFEEAKKAQEEYTNTLTNVERSIENLVRGNKTEEIEKEIEIETEFEKHKSYVEAVKGELEVKIKIEGQVTDEQQAIIDDFLANLQNSTGKVEIKIKNKRDETKLEIKQRTNKTEREIEIETESLEEKYGLRKYRKEKAWSKIIDAEEDMNSVLEDLAQYNITNETTEVLEIFALLENAKEAFAFGEYTRSIEFSKAAKKSMKQYKEQFEDDDENEIEIEVEVKQTGSKVKIELDELEYEFFVNATSQERIKEIISERTGLTQEEIEAVWKFKIEEEDDENEIEIEVEVENGVAKVKAKFNETEKEFTLNVTTRAEIVEEIVERTGLALQIVEKRAEFEFETEDSDEEETRSLDEEKATNSNINNTLVNATDDSDREEVEEKATNSNINNTLVNATNDSDREEVEEKATNSNINNTLVNATDVE